MRTRHGFAPARTLGVPALIAAATLAGLLIALLGDGVYDWIAWVALTVPVAIVILSRWLIKHDAVRASLDKEPV
jgi:hypothetical protein